MGQYPSTEPVMKGKDVTEFKIGFIADLDKLSQDKDEKGRTFWKSYLAEGTLTWDAINKRIAIDMPEGSVKTVTSQYAARGRGMELSALISHNGVLYSVDDKTGIVFEIKNGEAIPRSILADGDGNEPKGFKGEWMTIKDDMLYVGGHGREFINDKNEIRHTNYMWVKIITKEGGVKHVNWYEKYDNLRKAAGCPFPGYLIHEAALWSSVHNKWFFLPRKVSTEMYDYKLDEQRAGNILLISNETFDDIQVVKIGKLNKTRGYSSFKFIPGTNDEFIVAVKSEEIDESQKSFITVFKIDGEVLLEDHKFSDKKYEGIEFL